MSRTQWAEEHNQDAARSVNSTHQQPRTAVALNKWFSGAYSFPSEPLFVYPGAFRLTTAGLEIGIPQVTATEKLLSAPFIRWCSVRGNEPVTNATVAQHTDWGITLAFETGGGTWRTHITQGSPIVYISDLTTPLHITCEPSILPSTHTARAVFAQPGSKGALLFQSSDGSAMQATEMPYSWQLSSATNQYRVSILPDESEQTLSLFSGHGWNQVVSTEISWESSDKEVLTTYDLQTSSNQLPLITLLPHQAANVAEDVQVLASYDSVLGPLQLVSKLRFTTRLPLPDLPLQFTAATDTTDRALIIAAIRRDTQRYLSEAPPDGVYFKGTWIGALTTLMQLSQLYAVEPEQSQLQNRLESVLIENLEGFSYDAENRLFLAANPEFGHEKGNDHHFHYGYYLRAMAVLSAKNPALLAEFQPIAKAMISDIAQDKELKEYPRLHYFSPYEGHSWADAQGKFADGNNQESTSEALQAWYGVKLWGEVTGQSELVTLGSWLYAQELSATQNYWYAAANPFPSGYERTMASLVWGGKREFNTWFSVHPLHIHGIQWLPLTPASVYGLAQLPLAEATAELERLEPNPAGHEWGDLYVSILAFIDPNRARSLIPTVTTFAGTKSEAVFLQFALR